MSQQQASVPVSPLRRRMLDDMVMRGLHEDTQRNYIMSVRIFAAFLGRSPETATPEDVRRFQIHQAGSGVQPPTINNSVSGLRFLFNVTLDRPDLSRRLVLVRYAQKLPTVLNVEEVGRLLEAARGPKYRAALGVAYGAGLRVSEVVGLRTGVPVRRGPPCEGAGRRSRLRVWTAIRTVSCLNASRSSRSAVAAVGPRMKSSGS